MQTLELCNFAIPIASLFFSLNREGDQCYPEGEVTVQTLQEVCNQSRQWDNITDVGRPQ